MSIRRHQKNEAKPSWIHQTKDNLVLGICGFRENEIDNFSEFKLHILSNKQKSSKPIFSNSARSKVFLAVERRDGVSLVEKVKVDKEYVELFKHDIICDKNLCTVKKEICLVLNKVKQKWIFEKVKNSKIRSRMKKAGC